jgi:hypothetical protein
LAAGATVSARIWDFKIRKYVQPEPQHGSWYPEESITVTQARLNVNVEPSWLSYIAFTLDYPTQVLFAPWSNIVGTGSHTVTVLDEKVRVNGSYVFGFKCWKKGGEIVSFDKSYTFTLSAGTTDITIVYVAHNVSIVSDPEMYVRVKIDDFQVQTPTTVYRGSGYYNFEALDTQLYYNATHMLKFYGWYVDNVYIGSDPNVNIYISYKTTIKLAYKAVEVPAPPPMTFKASVVDLGQIQAGTSKDFAITVTFDATALTIQSVEFQAKSDWLQVVDTVAHVCHERLGSRRNSHNNVPPDSPPERARILQHTLQGHSENEPGHNHNNVQLHNLHSDTPARNRGSRKRPARSLSPSGLRGNRPTHTRKPDNPHTLNRPHNMACSLHNQKTKLELIQSIRACNVKSACF